MLRFVMLLIGLLLIIAGLTGRVGSMIGSMIDTGEMIHLNG